VFESCLFIDVTDSQQNVIILLLVTCGMNYIKHEQFVTQNLFAELYN